ncbi:TIGR04282 family arsenosugar biosynthesis glycosyltransferase [Amylibacter sp. IMCC11727]|uniref:TIGR04282 family arsenosugar biosynthesis glycosyltransferase n=1 Tax=Amylibacter sp. IMCC11727 TaxID=3039851 RepID=UPI00244DFFB8|nr:TIGR04282 family arsenosugar biosynthesis glycosyltransferase [Amylibacter sp. IMCC11727]WGI22339.1 TIGR04282 family arsenosugar biosynthesis glycosyltransferase [Amylibacter sp. IMCC11727]
MRRQLYIMVKEPHPGRVKTRLGRDLGLTRAAWWFRHQTRRLIRTLARDPRWDTVFAVSPDIEGLQSRVWPAGVMRQPQGTGNLGDRMARIFRSAPSGPVVIIGADIPDVTPRLIAKAFAALGDHDAVFGPAPDGGFWLIGLKNTKPAPRDLFKDVRWSSEYALGDTLKTLGHFRVAQIDTLQDIDTIDDLNTTGTV